MNKLGVLLIAVLFGTSAWFHYQTHLQLIELQQQNMVLNQQLVVVGEQLASISTQLSNFEVNSLDGLVRDANDALLSGWESLVNTVGEELKKAREELPESQPSNPTVPSSPPLESPDGTERI